MRIVLVSFTTERLKTRLEVEMLLWGIVLATWHAWRSAHTLHAWTVVQFMLHFEP